MSNFNFLTEWPTLQEYAKQAESLVNSDPRASCFYSRYTLERMVKWMFEFDNALYNPGYDNSLNTLINEQSFKRALKPNAYPKIYAVKRAGNEAVHSERKVTPRESTQCIKELHHIFYAFYRTYTTARPIVNQIFDINLIPQTVQVDAKVVLTSAKKLRALQKELDVQYQKNQTKLEKERAANQALQAENNQLKQALTAQKALNESHSPAQKDPHDYNEDETRAFYIDQDLKAVGWRLEPINNGPKVKEFKVSGMPISKQNPNGNGRVDYVLWGKNGKPLAVVEAKRTSIDADEGKRQAELYADCLEKDTRFAGQRPLIYYTNGDEIHYWDDTNDIPRQVQGFMTQDEMQLVINRRTTALPLKDVELDTNIAGKGRAYQRLAIESVCEQFDIDKKRKSLLVMATGTGKTRTTIALVDILMRANWAKNILFLADRNALVSQAKKEFTKLLPKSSPEILSGNTCVVQGRLCLSTYPTIMNLLSKPADKRLFSVGHFDLVIVDEAHRSVYKKYRHIFDYFDGLLLGLTATPKKDLDKNTFDIFEQPEGNPTFAYELQEAVDNGFLVPPKDVQVTLGFMERGIKYSQLNKHEQQQWEEKEQLEEREEVLPSEVNQFLFNTDTVDKALEILMTRGIKVAGGDRLGKTIIFAANNDHANFIVKRFDANYRRYKGKFARVITFKEKYAESLIEEFKGERKTADPNIPLTIAVSVDMLDTGIDVPEVVNLVFFKVIKSKVKFMQMLGRGTRLCEDLFGPDEHKAFFKVFDCCRNFEYFEHNPDGATDSNTKPVSQVIFEKRLILSQQLLDNDKFGEYGAKLQSNLIEILYNRVAGMNLGNFIVRPVRPLVQKYQDKKAWVKLTVENLSELEKQIAPLPTEAEPINPDEKEQELALRFDHMLLTMQLALTESNTVGDYYQDKLTKIAAKLEGKASAPEVEKQLDWLQYIQSANFWTDVSLEDLEQTRRKLRLLMHLLKSEKGEPVFTSFQDEVLGVEENQGVYEFSQDGSLDLYRKKVEQYIRANQDDLTIQRIKRNLPITKLDLEALDNKLFEASGISDLDTYQESIHPDKSLGVFIRELIGLDRGAAKAAFADYLDEAKFNSQQISFVNTIIDYLTSNGVMDPKVLFEQPFTDMHYQSVMGLFDQALAVDIRTRIEAVTDKAVGE